MNISSKARSSEGEAIQMESPPEVTRELSNIPGAIGGQKQKKGMTCLQLKEQLIYLAPGKVGRKVILKAQYGVNYSLRSK